MVVLDKVSTLIKHNLDKAKGQYLSFGFIICLTAFIMNIALVLAFQTFSAYDSRFFELNTADVNFIIPQDMDDEEILIEIEKIDGVSEVEKHGGILVSATVREFANSDFDMNIVFYNIDEGRKLNLIDVSEYVKKDENTVYIPMYMKKMGGFSEGGSITYSVDGKEHTYKIGGIVSEMQYGNYGTGLIGGYFPSPAYESFSYGNSENLITEYSLRTDNTADLLQIKNAITDILTGRGINSLNINDKDSCKQTRTMVCTLLIIIFLALAAIILAVSIFLSSFRLRSEIENEMPQMGVLKGIGYTSKMIICAAIMPYTLVGIVSTVAGGALSYTILPYVAEILAIQSGFIYTPVFDYLAMLTAVIITAIVILLFAYISARKIYKLEPIDAIRGNRGNESAGQNILLSALSVGIIVLLSFAGTLLYNVSVKPDNFMNTILEESPSVIFMVQGDKMSDAKKLLNSDGRVRLALEYASASVNCANESLAAFVCEDFGKITNDICYEGCSPAREYEIAVGNAIAENHPIGSEIEISVSGRSAFYVVTGYIQSVNNAGKVCQLTSEGYKKIGESMNTLNVYLNDKIAEEFIAEYEAYHDTLIESSVNYEQLSENGRKMYAGVVSAVAVVLFVISVLLALLVLYVIINSIITRGRREFGIYKAIGYTSRQLAIMTAARLIPVVALSSVLSAVAGIWYLPAVNHVILSRIGAIKNYFEIPIWVLLAAAIIFTVTAFLISIIMLTPIKKITAYSLLKD